MNILCFLLFWCVIILINLIFSKSFLVASTQWICIQFDMRDRLWNFIRLVDGFFVIDMVRSPHSCPGCLLKTILQWGEGRQAELLSVHRFRNKTYLHRYFLFRPYFPLPLIYCPSNVFAWVFLQMLNWNISGLLFEQTDIPCWLMHNYS